MGKKKKPFIDKKQAQSFHLVHRSQRDPLQADEDSSRHVLLPVGAEEQSKPDDDSTTSQGRADQELREHGIFFEDGYDYMQHLKPRTNLALEPLPDNVTVIEAKSAPSSRQFGNIKLPEEAFASAHEEEEGLLNLAVAVKGPRPDWDPDVVAALDEALDLDDPSNILDDDFISKANASPSKEMESGDDSDWEDEDDYFPSDEAADEMESDDGESYFMEEETKSRFTNYSMTSSVIRRNEGLQLVDERFEKLMEEYDEDEIGALDHEDLAGTIDPDSVRLNALAHEFLEGMQKEPLSDVQREQELAKAAAAAEEGTDSEGSPVELVKIQEPPKEQWDCESILSTYSNLYNHPKLIKDSPKVKHIKLSSKTGIPVGVLQQRHPDSQAKDARKHEDMAVSVPASVTRPRPRDETKEAKKLRKQAVKEERKVRRLEKKANKMIFKVEEHRQENARIHTQQQQGKKL